MNFNEFDIKRFLKRWAIGILMAILTIMIFALTGYGHIYNSTTPISLFDFVYYLFHAPLVFYIKILFLGLLFGIAYS